MNFSLSVMVRVTLLLQALSLISVGVAALPQGFVDEGIVSLAGPNSGTFARDANNNWLFFLATKNGEIRLVKDTFGVDTVTTPVLSLNVCENGERGLQTILAHPNFSRNGWLYVYYAPFRTEGCGSNADSASGPQNQLSRFTWSNGKLSGEKFLLRGPPNEKSMHNGGAMSFGNDGNIYLALGEGGTRSPPYSQMLWTLHGKMLRITDDGSIPDDNPFASGGVSCKSNGNDLLLKRNCAEIFSIGFRNPFRFAMDPNVNRVRYFINDVGGQNWEEISEGGDGFEMANYGWPIREGPCNTGSFTSGCDSSDPKFTDPIYWYGHFKINGESGRAVVGGAFIPNGVWSSKYDGTYLYAEFIEGKIYHMTKDEASSCRSCDPPVPKYKATVFHTFESPVDVFFGPYRNTQALYYLCRAENTINIRRIRFTGSVNRSPVAVISTTSALQGSAPLTISLDATKSTDPDNNQLSYVWDFGDGSARSSASRVTHTYTRNGQYQLQLTVKDTSGLTDQDFMTIVVGTPPSVSLLSPAVGTTFAVGDTFTLRATATDSNGKTLADSALVWEIRQHHEKHWHPWLSPTSGNSLTTSPAPSPEDAVAATNSYLEVRVTATDSLGLKTTISRKVMPRLVMLDFDTNPSDLEVLLVDENLVKTPVRITSWENHLLRVDLLKSQQHLFVSWSDGKAQKHSIRVPASGNNVPKFKLNLRSEKDTTSRPTVRPSKSPTRKPTTLRPTVRPSKSPTRKPTTLRPNVRPSKSPTRKPITSTAVATLSVRECSQSLKCGVCEGPCESTAECNTGLVCFQTSINSFTVPGCNGRDYSTSKWCTRVMSNA